MDLTKTVWLGVERAILNNLDPIALLTANKHPWTANIILKNTKNALFKVDQKMEVSIRNSKWESLWGNSKVKYKGKMLNFTTWSGMGISTPKQLEEGSEQYTFAKLKAMHNLPDIELYNFLRIRAALSKAELNKQESTILQYMANITKIVHQVSYLNKLLRPSSIKLTIRRLKIGKPRVTAPLAKEKDTYCGPQPHKTKSRQP